MAKKFHQATRMCLSCRVRDFQSKLIRFCCIDGELSSFNGEGRSFYFCKTCQEDEKKLSKALMRTCRSGDRERLINKLKEIITDDR